MDSALQEMETHRIALLSVIPGYKEAGCPLTHQPEGVPTGLYKAEEYKEPHLVGHTYLVKQDVPKAWHTLYSILRLIARCTALRETYIEMKRVNNGIEAMMAEHNFVRGYEMVVTLSERCISEI
jgi:hypothetical protein